MEPLIFDFLLCELLNKITSDLFYSQVHTNRKKKENYEKTLILISFFVFNNGLIIFKGIWNIKCGLKVSLFALRGRYYDE